MFRSVTLAFLVLVAGCAGGGGAGTTTPSPPIRAAATPATLDAPGYAERRADAPWVNTTITARIEGDVTLQTTREVRARTARRVYARSTPAGPAVVGLYAVPSVKPFDNADLRKNPAAGLSSTALFGRAQSVYADVRDLSTTDERSVTVLGTTATLTQYRGVATRNGSTRSIDAALVTVAHGGDYVTVALVTPRERDAPLDRLLRAVRHKKGAESR